MSEPQEKAESEEKKRGASENERPGEQAYEMKGIAGHFYLTENGEFRWIPSFKACADKESTKKIIEVLRKMPDDRRAVWAQRLDLEQAKIACPVIRSEVDLCSEFDDLCTAYRKPPTDKKPDEKRAEVNSQNE